MAERFFKMIAVQNRRAIGCVLIGSVFISIGPFFVEFANVSAVTSAFYRMLIGGIAFFLIAVYRQERLLNKWIFLPALFAAAILASDLTMCNMSILYIGSGISTVLSNLEVVFLALIGFFFFQEKIPPLFGVMSCCLGIGVIFLCYIHIFEGDLHSVLGIILALGASMIYSVYLTLLKIIGIRYQTVPSTIRLSVICLLGATLLGVWMVTQKPIEFVISDWRGVACIFSNSIISQVLGWWFIAEGIGSLSLALTGGLMLTQPALTYFFDGLFLKRNISWFQICGCVLLLFTIYNITKRKTKQVNV